MLTLPAAALAAALVGLAAAQARWDGLGRAGLAGGVLFAAYLALHLIRPTGLGMGDVKLAATIGLLLGWLSWGALVGGTAIAFVSAAATGAVLMLSGRGGRGSAFAFGPFMLAGAWAAVLATSPVESAVGWLVA